jgi:2-keto-3-deoxy-L-rhamnonate aldolase RhmA
MASIKDRIHRSKEPLGGYVCLIPSPVVTQALAAAGADWVVIDQEHAPIGPENLHAMVAATAGTACSPWVRVSRRDEAFVKPALDAGAEGILFPLVRTAADAAECVALTAYPPRGRRGWGPFVPTAVSLCFAFCAREVLITAMRVRVRPRTQKLPGGYKWSSKSARTRLSLVRSLLCW